MIDVDMNQQKNMGPIYIYLYMIVIPDFICIPQAFYIKMSLFHDLKLFPETSAIIQKPSRQPTWLAGKMPKLSKFYQQ